MTGGARLIVKAPVARRELAIVSREELDDVVRASERDATAGKQRQQ